MFIVQETAMDPPTEGEGKLRLDFPYKLAFYQRICSCTAFRLTPRSCWPGPLWPSAWRSRRPWAGSRPPSPPRPPSRGGKRKRINCQSTTTIKIQLAGISGGTGGWVPGQRLSLRPSLPTPWARGSTSQRRGAGTSSLRGTPAGSWPTWSGRRGMWTSPRA